MSTQQSNNVVLRMTNFFGKNEQRKILTYKVEPATVKPKYSFKSVTPMGIPEVIHLGMSNSAFNSQLG